MIKCRLRVLLAEHELSQKELAEITGIQPMTINKLYNNHISRIPVDVLDKLCNYFKCQPSDIFQYSQD